MNRLSTQQRAVLAAIREHPGVSTVDLRSVPYESPHTWSDETTLCITGTAVANVLARLRKRALVEGTPSTDGPWHEWRVTDAGLKAIGWTR